MSLTLSNEALIHALVHQVRIRCVHGLAGMHSWLASTTAEPSNLCKHASLTHQLVHQVRLWCVHGLAGMPHVLSAVEVLEGKASQEVSGVHQASSWADLQAAMPHCRVCRRKFGLEGLGIVYPCREALWLS